MKGGKNMNFKGKRRKNEGITLIALVITIIVLLILAGVTIAMLSGNNSAPQKATEAAQKDAIAGAKDEIAMEVQEALLNYYNNTYVEGNGTKENSIQEVVSEAASTAVENAEKRNSQLLESSGVSDNTITLNTKSYTVTGEIDENGGITWSDIGVSTGGSTPETEVVPNVGDTVNYAPSESYTWDKSLAESDKTSVGEGKDTLSSEDGGEYRITKWKILSYDPISKMVEMVPTEPVGNLTLKGAQGYNNAVYLLNQACSNLYGNSSKGIEARSIQEEDFVKAGGDTWMSYKEGYEYKTDEGDYVQYDHQYKEYTSDKKYPSIYAKEYQSVIDGNENKESGALNKSSQKDKISATADEATYGYKESETSIKPYQTYYYTSNYDKTKELLGDKMAGILLPNGNSTQYWVASRCVFLYFNHCDFDVRNVNSGYLGALGVFVSGGSTGYNSRALFPVVSLNSKLLVEGDEENTYDVKID